MPSNSPERPSNGSDWEASKPGEKTQVTFTAEHLCESDDSSGDEPFTNLSRQATKEIKKRRNTIINSFRLAELVPTTHTPFSSYRRKSVVVLTAQTVVDAKAEQQ